MYQTKLFPTLDSYMSRRRDKVSQTVHAKIENRIEALMKERYKERVFMNADLYGFTREFRLTDSCIEPRTVPHLQETGILQCTSFNLD